MSQLMLTGFFGILLDIGPVVQLVRIRACHARGRGFESRPDRFLLRKTKKSTLKALIFKAFFISTTFICCAFSPISSGLIVGLFFSQI